MGKTARSKNYRNKKKQNHFNSSSNQAQATTSYESDIPGYYYDEEKKTYFKILPNTMSSVGSFITRETIKKNKEESRRQRDRNKAIRVNETTHASSSSSSISTSKKAKSNILGEPLLNTLRSVQCGQHTCQSLQNYLKRERCQKLRPQPGWETGRKTTFTNAHILLEGIQRMELTEDCEKFVAVWSVKGLMSQWIKLMTLNAKKKQNASDIGKHLNLSFNDAGYLGVSADKVTSMCWSPLSKVPGKACMLYTTVCPVGYNGSRVCVVNLEAAAGDEIHVFSFDLGRNSVWSCAWNQHRSRFSVGCERRCHVIDVTTRCKWTYSTHNSDCLAQIFSSSNPHLLYTGTRNGYIHLLDLRCSQMNYNVILNQKKSVVCLRSLKDENYLMASDYSGMIRRWDLRFQKIVKSYNGLTNSHYQIPFYLDDTEKFIYGTGSDGYCKIWSLSDELPLSSLAPPLPFQPTDSFPVSHLSEKWGGLDGNFGVVTGMENSFFLYS